MHGCLTDSSSSHPNVFGKWVIGWQLRFRIRPRFFYGWYVAATCLLVYMFTNGMSIFVPQNLFPRFMETFAATEGEVSRTVAFMFLVPMFLAPFGGALIDRFGPIRVIRIGLVIMAICFAVYPLAQSVRQLIVIHLGLGLGLVFGGLLVNVMILSNWFVRRRGCPSTPRCRRP